MRVSPLMSPKKCDEEAVPDFMTKIRSTKTDSNKYFRVYSNISMTLFSERDKLRTPSSDKFGNNFREISDQAKG